MKLHNILFIVICIFTISFFPGCDGDDDEFLKRNLKELKFDYREASQEFTIRASGSWSISIPNEFSWIHVDPMSGSGDGVNYQKIVVTCDRNTAEERDGAIFLNGSGESDVEIKIFQNNGLFEWTTYSNGMRLAIEKPLKVGDASTASIAIPYIKAIGNETFPIEITLSGKGSAGLSVGQTSAQIAEEGDGLMLIPISGTPTTQGGINVAVKVKGEDFGTITTLAGMGETILKQSFDKFLWGGDCIGNKAGVSTTKPTASMTLGDETAVCAIGTNGANGSGVTSTIRNSNSSFYAEIEMTGWLGLRNYMRPGYIQLGATSATALEFGSLISPGLNIPTGSTYDILVTFRAAIYNTPWPERILVGLYPKGVDGLKIADVPKITQKTYVPFDIPTLSWGEFSCVIPNASDAAALLISLPEELVSGGAVQAGRIYIDDIVVAY